MTGGGPPPSAAPHVDAGIALLLARARLTAGADMWTTVPNELGIPVLRLSDGPSGVRGPQWDERDAARCTPCGVGLASTWDPELIYRVGRQVAHEARQQDVHVVLGPMINIPRSPLGGRAFECYSEDPLLSGEIAAAWIAGVQSEGVAACPKHLVANDSETSRTRIDVVVDERALREIYLLPFEYATRAGAWAMMAAYNRVNGIHATQHGSIIRSIVKDEWRWDGVMMSDWFGAHDTVACALAGLDLEMPGPARVFGEQLAHAVLADQVPVAEVDDKVQRIRLLAERTGAGAGAPTHMLQRPAGQESSADALLVEAAAAGFVLLKNEAATLPLDLTGLSRTIAVIGPNAVRPCRQGGGSAQVNMRPRPSLTSVLKARFGSQAVIGPEPGCAHADRFQGLHELGVRRDGGAGPDGLEVAYLPQGELIPTFTEFRDTSRLTWLHGVPGLDRSGRGVIRVSTTFRPERDGVHVFAVRGSGPTRLLVNSREVAVMEAQSREGEPLAAWFCDDWGEGEGDLRAGVGVLVEIEMMHEPADDAGAILEFGCRTPEPANLLDRAVTLAAAADAVVLVVGTSAEVESESKDRQSTQLGAEQDALVTAVIAANPNTVVVVNAGSAVSLPWQDDTRAILLTWFAGDAFAEALTAVVSGDVEPGGRLPITVADQEKDYAAYRTDPDADLRLTYTESVFVGYRHFDQTGNDPAFCFGHGLGYTEFEFVDLEVTDRLRAGEQVHVQVGVRNVGRRPGKEVVQLYVSDPGAPLPRPPRELKAFAAVQVAPGECVRVPFLLESRSFAYWDVGTGAWSRPLGRFGLHVGRSARDLRLHAEIELTA